MSRFKSLREQYGDRYISHPYTVPINKKVYHHTKIKALQVRMMKWVSWYKDEGIRNRTIDKDKWQHRFQFTLRCQRRAGKLNREELKQLNYYWRIYETK